MQKRSNTAGPYFEPCDNTKQSLLPMRIQLENTAYCGLVFVYRPRW